MTDHDDEIATRFYRRLRSIEDELPEPPPLPSHHQVRVRGAATASRAFVPFTIVAVFAVALVATLEENAPPDVSGSAPPPGGTMAVAPPTPTPFGATPEPVAPELGPPIPLRTGRPTGPGDPCPAALGGGKLVADDRWVVAIEDLVGDRTEVVWPFGFTARLADGRLLLVDATGAIVARESDFLRMVGGFGLDGTWHACPSAIEVVDPPR